jgi:hypothetical protein
MDFLKGFRVVAPSQCRQCTFLNRYYTPTNQEVDTFLKMALTNKNLPDIDEAFIYIIHTMTARAGINLIVDNVPDYGTRISDNSPDRITSRVFRDTMEQFGDVKETVMFSKRAYVWFHNQDDAIRTQKLINNMMIENNTIKATVVCI